MQITPRREKTAISMGYYRINGVVRRQLYIGVCKYGYGLIMGTGTGVLREQIQAHVWA